MERVSLSGTPLGERERERESDVRVGLVGILFQDTARVKLTTATFGHPDFEPICSQRRERERERERGRF